MTRQSKPVALCILIAALTICVVRAAPVTELKVMSFNIWVNGGHGLTQCLAAFHTTPECHSFTRLSAFPDELETIQVSRNPFLNFGRTAKQEGIGYLGGCCGCNAAYIRALKDGVAEGK